MPGTRALQLCGLFLPLFRQSSQVRTTPSVRKKRAALEAKDIKLRRMRDALPIVTRLVELNLDAMGVRLGSEAEHQCKTIGEPHIAWLFRVVEHLAESGDFCCRLLAERLGANQSSSAAFFEPQRLRPHGLRTHTAFAGEFGQALVSTSPAGELHGIEAAKRLGVVSRWIASAALTAHVCLVPGGTQRFQVVSIESPNEDDLTVEANLRSLLAGFSADLIRALPMYSVAEMMAATRSIDEIRRGIFGWNAEGNDGLTRKSMAAGVADLLAYCSTHLLGPAPKGRARKLHELAHTFLMDSGICREPEQAQSLLQSLGIGDSFEMRRMVGKTAQRLPTKNSEHQAAFRGKGVYLQHWASACANFGILNRALLDATTTSSKLIADLLGAIGDPDLRRALESCAEPTAAADVPASSHENSEIPRESHE